MSVEVFKKGSLHAPASTGITHKGGGLIGKDGLQGVVVRIRDLVNCASERLQRARAEDIVDTCGKDTFDEGGSVSSPRGAEKGIAHVEPAYLPIGVRKWQVVEITHDDERVAGSVYCFTHTLCLRFSGFVGNRVFRLEFLKVVFFKAIGF